MRTARDGQGRVLCAVLARHVSASRTRSLVAPTACGESHTVLRACSKRHYLHELSNSATGLLKTALLKALAQSTIACRDCLTVLRACAMRHCLHRVSSHRQRSGNRMPAGGGVRCTPAALETTVQSKLNGVDPHPTGPQPIPKRTGWLPHI